MNIAGRGASEVASYVFLSAQGVLWPRMTIVTCNKNRKVASYCTEILKLLLAGQRDLRCGTSSDLKQEYKCTLAERDLATVLLWG
jgi:hypothetical protein